MDNEKKGMILGLIGVTAFGLTLPVTKIVLPYMNPIFIGLGRAVIAGLVALVLLLVFKQKIPNIKQIKQLLLVSLGVVIGFPVLSSWAMQYVPASHGGVVLGILPLATAVVGVLIGNEKPSIYFWICSATGTALVVSYALLQGVGGLNIADLALLGAIISASVGYAIGGKLSRDIGGWQVICWALVLSLPFILIPAIVNAPESFLNIPLRIHFSFLYLALISQLFGFFFWYKGLALGGIVRVSQMQLFQPFITLLFSALLLGEVIDVVTLVFVVLVVCSVWLGKKMPIATNLKVTDQV
jgi:drug/metabolite transporter (DMT)-like permease